MPDLCLPPAQPPQEPTVVPQRAGSAVQASAGAAQDTQRLALQGATQVAAPVVAIEQDAQSAAAAPASGGYSVADLERFADACNEHHTECACDLAKVRA